MILSLLLVIGLACLFAGFLGLLLEFLVSPKKALPSTEEKP